MKILNWATLQPANRAKPQRGIGYHSRELHLSRRAADRPRQPEDPKASQAATRDARSDSIQGPGSVRAGGMHCLSKGKSGS